MGAYILRRLLLIIPTMFGIMALSFTIIQFAPGGPIEKIIADLNGQSSSATVTLVVASKAMIVKIDFMSCHPKIMRPGRAPSPLALLATLPRES